MSKILKSVFLEQNQHLFGWREAGLLSFPIIHLLPKNPFTHLDLPPFPQSLWDHHPHKHRFTHPDQSHDTTHGLLFAGVKAGGYLEDLGIDTSMDVSPTLRSVYIHSPYFPFLQEHPCVRRKQLRAGLHLSGSFFIYTITYFCFPSLCFSFLRLERLVEVLRKKVGTGSVRKVIWLTGRRATRADGHIWWPGCSV